MTSRRRSRQRASKRQLNAITDGRGPQLVIGNDPDMAPEVARRFREVHVLMLIGELELAERAHAEGKPWRFPFPKQQRSDGDPVSIAFVGWASGSADDDEIAAALWPGEYREATEIGAPAGPGSQHERLRERVRQKRCTFDRWRGGIPLRPWHLRPMRSETTEIVTACEDGSTEEDDDSMAPED